MKVKWIDKRKIIPKIGEVHTGDVKDMPEDMAKAFIKQGQARKVVIKKSKGGDE